MITSWHLLCAAFASALLMAAGACQAAGVTVWPAPAGEKLSSLYGVRVNGQAVPVQFCRVSAVPINQVWPGYQRPIDQSEEAAFATWDMGGPVTVEVTAANPFTAAVVRPLSRRVVVSRKGRTLTFKLAKPGQVTVELDGRHHALHLFANPLEVAAPKPNAPNVRYFGPGVHRPGRIDMKSGETLYVAGGAVVHGSVQVNGVTGVRIMGRGVIDLSEYERDKGGGCIRLSNSSDVKIEGVILRDPDVWCLSAFGCSRMEIANVKLVGLWRYNADGIDLCNSQDVVVRDSFIRAYDDAIVLKGLNWGPTGFSDRPVRGIRVRNNVIWCDWGRGLEIGAETSAPEFTDIVFSDCDIIRTTHIAMDIQCGDRARVHDVRYENIRLETDDICPSPKMQATRDEKYVENPNDTYVPFLLVIVIAQNPYSQDKERGVVTGITYKDLSVTGKRIPKSWFQGLDAEHTVSGITLSGVTFNGKPATTVQAMGLSLGAHVSGVTAGP